MIEIVDDFIKKVRGITSVQTDPVWAERINDLEVVLHALFVSDEAQAIEMSDQVCDVIGRKRVTIEKRMSMLQEILREGLTNGRQPGRMSREILLRPLAHELLREAHATIEGVPGPST